MIKTAFTCNSLRFRHFFQFIWKRISCLKPGILRNACVDETARFLNVPGEAVFLYGSGRMGLYSLLMAGKAEDKDEVIVAGYTCVVVTNAILYAGLKAVYIDVDEEHLNIDPAKLRSAVNRRTAAIVLTHNFGITCEYIDAFRKEFPEVMIIEDAAHTFGSVTSGGRLAGTLGNAAFFSLEYSKPLTSGMGGIVVVNDENLRKKLREIYDQTPYYPFLTRLKILASLKVHLFSSSRYNAFMKKWLVGMLYVLGLLYRSPKKELLGGRPKHYPVRLSAGLAWLVYLQLREVNQINARKKSLAEKYYRTFKSIQGIRQYYSPDYIYARYPVLFDKDVDRNTIEEVRSALKGKGIVPGEWFNDVVHPRGSYRYCYIDGSCPVGESISERMINFPISIHPQLTAKDLEYIRKTLIKHLGKDA